MKSGDGTTDAGRDAASTPATRASLQLEAAP